MVYFKNPPHRFTIVYCRVKRRQTREKWKSNFSKSYSFLKQKRLRGSFETAKLKDFFSFSYPFSPHFYFITWNILQNQSLLSVSSQTILKCIENECSFLLTTPPIKEPMATLWGLFYIFIIAYIRTSPSFANKNEIIYSHCNFFSFNNILIFQYNISGSRYTVLYPPIFHWYIFMLFPGFWHLKYCQNKDFSHMPLNPGSFTSKGWILSFFMAALGLCCGAQAVWCYTQAFSSCGTWVQELQLTVSRVWAQYLWHTDLVAPWHVGS